MLNIVVMVTGIRYVFHTRCVHFGDYDNCALVGKIWSYHFPSVSQIKTQISNLVLVFCAVLCCVLKLRVPYCDAGYDIRRKTMFDSHLTPVVLFALFVFVYGQWCPTHIVLCFCFVLYFVLCTLGCQFVFLGCPLLIVLSVFNFLLTFIMHGIFC